jgi:hypothetical protein
MAFIFNSTIDYLGATYNLNFVSPEDLIYKLKSLLKTAGWSVLGSGSGSVYSASDLFTADSSSMFVGQSWFAISSPDNRSNFTFQRSNVSTSTYNWRIKYSPGGFNLSTSTATKTPLPTIANDEIYTLGSGTDTTPTFGVIGVTAVGMQTMHIGASTTAGDNSFWFSVYQLGTLQYGCSVAMIYENLKTGSYSTSDYDPYIIYGPGTAYNGASTLTAGQLLSLDTTIGSSTGTGLQNSRWSGTMRRTSTQYGTGSFYGSIWALNYAFTYNNTLTTIAPKLLDYNPYQYSVDLLPIPFARFSAASSVGLQNGIFFNGWKGFSKNIGFISTTRPVGEMISVNSSGDYIVLGDVVVPWVGTQPNR